MSSFSSRCCAPRPVPSTWRGSISPLYWWKVFWTNYVRPRNLRRYLPDILIYSTCLPETLVHYSQNLLPFYLSRLPSINLETKCELRGYTRLLYACSSLYDLRGAKAAAIRLLVYRKANVRVRCEAFGNSTIHLALLSARDEVGITGSETWKDNSRDFQLILRDLLRAQADITVRNHAGFTASDVAVGLRCEKGWNDAMRDCGLTSHVIDVSRSVDQKFGQLWENCNHFDCGCASPELVQSKTYVHIGLKIQSGGMKGFLNGRSYE